jgi:hypothetical protein
MSLLSEVIPPAPEDRSLAGDVERARELVAAGSLTGGVRSPGIWFSPTPG